MNREIRFRVWTGKQMFCQEKQYLGSFVRRAVIQIMIDHEIENYRDHESYLPNGGNIDEYLMQYTGLQDKNGKEIYEGDTVIWDGGQYDIVFSSQDGGWVLKDDREDWECPSLYGVSSPKQSKIKVIGNIYEHPKQ